MQRMSSSTELEAAIARDNLTAVIRSLRSRCQGLLTKVAPLSSILHLSALLGQRECTKYLLGKPCFIGQVNSVDENGFTPLMIAVVESHFDVVQVLMDTEQCDLSIANTDQDNILHSCAQTRSKSAPMWFLEATVSQGVTIDKVNNRGLTPFLTAIKHYNTSVAHFLFRAGCNINHADHEEGMISLHYAIKCGYDDLVEWLVRIGVDINAQTASTQSTPLMLCVQLHRPPHQVFLMMKYLLDRGADPNIQDMTGNTCLLLAIANGHGIRKHHIEFLLVSGADPDIRNCHGLTPIWHSVYTGCRQDRMQIIQLLIQENCCLDTPCRGQLLFRLGSSAVYCYETCLSPLEVALDSCLYDVARVLILSGCVVKKDLQQEIANSGAPADLRQLCVLFESPSFLQHVTRLRLRKMLGRPLQSKVRRLPLPDTIKRFILLEDVLSELDSLKT